MTELCLPNQAVYVAPAAAFARTLALRLGFAESGAEDIRTAVDEGLCYLLSRSFEPGEEGLVRVLLEPQRWGLQIRIKDQGLPIDFGLLQRRLEEGSTRPRHLAVKVMRASMDEVSIRHLGREGNEIRLFKRLQRRPVTSPELLDRDPAPEDPGELVVRRMRPEEAVGVARCLYRSYGYTYAGAENAYSAEWLAEMNRSGAMVSAVALSRQGEVLGHCALSRAGSVWDMGQAAVDPRFRARGTLRKMIEFLLEQAVAMDSAVVYAEPVTSHVWSQRVTESFGFVDCGLLLASIPAEEETRGAGPSQERASMLSSVRLFRPPALPRLYLPERYRDIVDETLGRLGLSYEEGRPRRMVQKGALHWTVSRFLGSGRVEVERAGRDTPESLMRAIRTLLGEGCVVIHLDLDLADPCAPLLADVAVSNGFFYAGCFPGLSSGVTLRMQYLNQVDVRRETVCLHTSWARQLGRFVFADGSFFTEGGNR